MFQPLEREQTLHRSAQWSRITGNRDVNAGPLARPFAHLLAPLTHSLAPYYTLHSRTPLGSFVRLLAHSLPSSWESESLNVSKRLDFVPQWSAYRSNIVREFLSSLVK